MCLLNATGRLIALGTESSWISMRPEISTSNWAGIEFNQKFNGNSLIALLNEFYCVIAFSSQLRAKLYNCL